MSKLVIALLILNFFLFGFLIGVSFMQNYHCKHYAKEHDRITASVISRMTRAMLSLCYDREQIDLVIERMGVKIFPPSTPAPTHVLTPKKNRENSDE